MRQLAMASIHTVLSEAGLDGTSAPGVDTVPTLCLHTPSLGLGKCLYQESLKGPSLRFRSSYLDSAESPH